MGQNSTDISYQFGQMGSAHTDLASQLRPPKGMVIIAIQFLGNNTLSELTAEITENNIEYVGTAAAAHDTGDFTTTGHNNNGNADHDTGEITLGAASPLIKPGMIVESATLCPYSASDPFVVLSHDGTTTAEGLVIAKKSSPHLAVDHAGNVAGGAAENMFFFHERTSGFGGIAISGVKFPKGMIIYGRWTSVTPAVDTDGGIIAYFGY